MNRRDERLHQFFAGYFNQDWDINGATSWSEVVDEYVAENRPEVVIATRDDLLSWLHDSDAAADPAALGCDYDPRPDGLDPRNWVAAIAEYITRKAGD